MSKSKAGVLKRYLSSSTSESNEVMSRKKRKKKQASVTGGVRVVDADDWGNSSGIKGSTEDGEGEEDGPLIVDDKGDQIASLNEHDMNRGSRNGDHRVQDSSPPRRRRHDSPDASPPHRKQRHDSPDASPPRRRKRHDSPPKAAADDASPPRRRQRHDSPDASPPRRRKERHDKADDASPPRRKRHDSPDTSPPRRRKERHDSPNDASPPRRRQRHDSPPEEDDNSPPRRRERHDSPVQEDKGREATEKKEVGLKTGEEFRKEMEAKKAEQDKLWSGMEAEFSGQNAETVVRDRKGRKLEMLSEFMNQEAFKEGKAAKQAKEEYEWGRGLVQKGKDEEYKKELEDIKNQPFARYESDPQLERMRKAEIRADDPMAEYMMKQVRKERLTRGIMEKPEYKGPAARPNRFNIKPGYRWDGIDRGNGFEARWFKRQHDLVEDKQRREMDSRADL